jgi:hypothetical protein
VERLGRGRRRCDCGDVMFRFMFPDELVHRAHKKGQKSELARETVAVPIILLRDSLSEHTRLPINSELLQILKIDI